MLVLLPYKTHLFVFNVMFMIQAVDLIRHEGQLGLWVITESFLYFNALLNEWVNGVGSNLSHSDYYICLTRANEFK